MKSGFKSGTVTPDEVGALGSKMAMVKGIAQGIAQKITQAAGAQVANGAQLADTVAETLADAINDPIGDAGLVATGTMQKLQGGLVAAMKPAVETALSVGYDPAGIMRPASNGAKKKRAKRASTRATDSTSEVVDDPPIAQVPDVNSLPGSYTIVANCTTGQSGAIPGDLSAADHLAGWMVWARVSILQEMTAAQLSAAWTAFVKRIGCPSQAATTVPTAATAPAAPPTTLGSSQTGAVAALYPLDLPAGWVCGYRIDNVTASELTQAQANGLRVLPANPNDPNKIPWLCGPPLPVAPLPAPPPPGGLPPLTTAAPIPPPPLGGLPAIVAVPTPPGSVNLSILAQPPPPEAPSPAPSPKTLAPSPAHPQLGTIPITPPGASPEATGAPAKPVSEIPTVGASSRPSPATPLTPGLRELPPPPATVPAVGGAAPVTAPAAPFAALPAAVVPIQSPLAPPGLIGFPPPFGFQGGGTTAGTGLVSSLPPAGFVATPTLPIAPTTPTTPTTPTALTQPFLGPNLTCPAPVVNVNVPPAPPCPAPESVPFMGHGFSGKMPYVPPPPGKLPEFVGPEKPKPLTIQDFKSFCLPMPDWLRQLAGKSVRKILEDSGFLDASGNAISKKTIDETVESAAPGFGWITPLTFGAINAVISWGVSALDTLAEFSGDITGCGEEDIPAVATVELLVGVLKRWLFDIPPSLTRTWDQYAQWVCNVGLPTQEESDRAYVAGRVNDDEWKCLTRANGNEERFHEAVRDAGLPTPDWTEFFQLKRRGLLNDSNREYLRQRAGIRSPETEQILERLTDWIPSPSDAIDWMLKDINDPNIVGTFGLGAEFQQKYSGHVKEVFEQNAVSEENANSIWLAHWKNMAPHQLYELHKRLRPGWSLRLSPEQALETAQNILPQRPPNFEAPKPPAGFTGAVPLYFFLDNLPAKPEPQPANVPQLLSQMKQSAAGQVVNPYVILENLVTTGYHVYEGLGQADFPPFWRERLLAISYTVMTRVDMRRAYETNQLSYENLIHALQDRGYSPTDAATLGGFFRASLIQLAARRPAANTWVKEGYSQSLLRQQLIDTGMRPELYDEVFATLKTRREAAIQVQCIRAIHKRFDARLLSDSEAMLELGRVGVQGQEQLDLIAAWRCLRANRAKEVSAAVLCRFFKAKLINRDSFRRELRNLGYMPKAINQLLAECERKKERKGGDYRTSIHIDPAPGLDEDAPLNPPPPAPPPSAPILPVPK